MKTKLSLLFVSLFITLKINGQCTSNYMNISKVVQSGNTLTITYFDNSYTPQTCTFTFTSGNEVFTNTTKNFRTIVSVYTLPFKIRKAQDGKPQFASAGLKNIGINLSPINIKMDRYFPNNTFSTHKFSMGLLIVPGAEELNPDNTDGLLANKSNQLFISTGVSITYSYNLLTFAFIPAGYDFATTSDGKKWMYNQKWWWGFGIGVDTKLFGF